ncbi:MAG: radical SAM family heme chaperone HemW [Gammaproteobacteria bacterium]|nr:radical SAM family heme chaperone HemW [Gammaproteobacteria bacterium]
MAATPAPPLALYLHFPWCVRKCPYCDFNSHALQGELPQQAYLEALLADLDAQLQHFGDLAGRPVVSLFLGGGTPSLFEPEALGRLFEQLRARIAIAPAAEITLEANPGTIERGRFTDYRDAGINRVSLGAQSFAPRQLETLGRIHNAQDTLIAVDELRAAGIANFNLDLMYALPGQDVAGALADLRTAIELRPAHLSHYQLTMEPGTVFGSLPPPGLPDDDLAWSMQQACQAELARAGYAQYETSAYAHAGTQCTHNLNYWRFGDYLGVGAGAHGKLTQRAGGAISRTVREREPRRYLARGHRDAPPTSPVASIDLPFEFMMNALRLVDGFEESLFETRTGLAWSELEAPVSRLRGRGLLESIPAGGRSWRPTELGRRFLNDAIAEFLPTRPGP